MWPTTLCPANTTRQPNAGSMLVHRRGLCPSTIQHWTVLSVGGGVFTEYKLTQIQCLLNVGPASVTLAHIQCGTKHDTVAQHWANVGPAS